MSLSPNRFSLQVSIVSYAESIDCLIATISSLMESFEEASSQKLCDKPCRIVIVDNRDLQLWDLAALLQEIDQTDTDLFEFDLVQGHGNVGYGHAHNLAIDTKDDGYHLFLNPDVVLEKNCIGAGIKYLEINQQVGMVTPLTINKLHIKQFLCKRYPAVFDLFLRGFLPTKLKCLFKRRLARYEMQELSEHEPTQGIPIASGCFMLCRKKTISEIGGFDSTFFLYFEDFDLSIRLNEIAKIAYHPKMRIVHGGGNAARKGVRHIIYFIRSAWAFYSKYGWRWF